MVHKLVKYISTILRCLNHHNDEVYWSSGQAFADWEVVQNKLEEDEILGKKIIGVTFPELVEIGSTMGLEEEELSKAIKDICRLREDNNA